MTGERIAQLMSDPYMKRTMARLARRYSKCPEDQEEYIADAWMRISGCHDDESTEALEREAGRGMNASRMRMHYAKAVQKKSGESLHGISVSHASDYKRSDLLPLGRGRYVVRTPERLSGWYYHGEWEEYGLSSEGMQVRSFYRVVLD